MIRAIVGAALIVASGVLAWLWLAQSDAESGEGGQRLVGVEVRAVESRSIEQTISSTGTLVAPEAVVVTTEVAGRVESLGFREGTPIAKGDVLVVLERAREQSRVVEARARVEQTRRELERVEALREADFASEERLDAARTALSRARAELVSATESLADHSIEAPFDGITGRRLVSPGAVLAPGDVVTRIVMTKALDLLFEVPGNWVGRLRQGQSVRARTAAYPERTFEGQVRFVGSELDVATRSLPLEATIPNEEGLLKPGMFMRVELVVGEREALTVPEAAIVSSGPASFTFVVDEESVVRRVPVTPGVRRAGWVEIVEGLDAQDRVVVSGLQKVRDGTRVTTQESGAS